MDWRELDRNSASWTLPKERAKNGSSSLVPLNSWAVELLDLAAGTQEWPKQGIVFATSGGKPFSGFAKGKVQLDMRLESPGAIEAWRIHDLRRTLATGLQRLGTRFEVVEAVLNHVSGTKSGVAGIYQRHDWADEKRVALQVWGRHIAGLLTPQSDTNVIRLPLAESG